MSWGPGMATGTCLQFSRPYAQIQPPKSGKKGAGELAGGLRCGEQLPSSPAGIASPPVQWGNARKGAPYGRTLCFPRENSIVKRGPSEGCSVQGLLLRHKTTHGALGSSVQSAQSLK